MIKRAAYQSSKLSGVRSVDRFGDISYSNAPLKLILDSANNFENGTYNSATLGYPVSFLLECYEKATEGGSQAARQRLAQVFRLGELGQEVDLLRCGFRAAS